MNNLTPGSLWQAQQPYFGIINPGDVLELTKIEYGPSGEALSLTFVPFTGPAITLSLQPASEPQCYRNVSDSQSGV